MLTRLTLSADLDAPCKVCCPIPTGALIMHDPHSVLAVALAAVLAVALAVAPGQMAAAGFVTPPAAEIRESVGSVSGIGERRGNCEG